MPKLCYIPCNESEMQVKEFVNQTTGAYMALYQPTTELKYVYHALLVYSLWLFYHSNLQDSEIGSISRRSHSSRLFQIFSVLPTRKL